MGLCWHHTYAEYGSKAAVEINMHQQCEKGNSPFLPMQLFIFLHGLIMEAENTLVLP